jgi:hypothetical protein
MGVRFFVSVREEVRLDNALHQSEIILQKSLDLTTFVLPLRK